MISVGRNQNQIFGKIDGIKITNLPLDIELFNKLNAQAKLANEFEKSGKSSHYKNEVKIFKALLNDKEVVEKVVAEKQKKDDKVVKVGTGNLSIKLGENGKPYLINSAGLKSKFYIPDTLYQRIITGEDKGLDTTPFYKFFIRVLKNPVMTQTKLANLDRFISKQWFNQVLFQELLEKGYTESKARSESTFPQVPITQEGLLHTYKTSRLIRDGGYNVDEYIDEEDDEEVEETAEKKEVDLTNFKFKPVRNSKGHFLARGSQEYEDAYNKQLTDFTISSGQAEPTKTLVNKQDNSKIKVKATQKTAEDYTFQPPVQGNSGDAFYCGDVLGHIIKVGHLHKLPEWSMVNTNDHTTGQKGLHVGGLEYIDGYTKWGSNHNPVNPTHNIFVDPQFIGAVAATETGDGVMRVKEYFVHSSFVAPNKAEYNSSTYAAKTDEEWDNQLKEAYEIIEKAKEAQKLIDNSFVI